MRKLDRRSAAALGVAGVSVAPLASRRAHARAAAAGFAEAGFAEALERVAAALAAMGSGDPEPYIGCWAETEGATLFGALGPIERGHRRLAETFRWVGGRFGAGRLVPQNAVAFASGDLAYTVGFERGEVAVDGGPVRPMTIRVTHVYRHIDGAWRLVHRHADFPPADPRRDVR